MTFRSSAISQSRISRISASCLGIGARCCGRSRNLRRDFHAAPNGRQSAPRDGAERRQLTVMFCDLVGSSALSVRLDPEDLRAVIGAYHTCIAEVIARNEGVIARYMGDGVLAYFGYPQAHEDDAEQATRAGLALVDAVADLQTDIGTRLQVRVGIATGMVVVGDLTGEGAAKEQAVIGETPNLAARLQAFAKPGTVLICESTRRLTEGHFEYRNLGPVMLKGWPEPLPAWQVQGTSGVESRFEAQHKTRLTPPHRARRGDRFAVASLAQRHAWRRLRRGADRRAGYRKIAYCVGAPRAAPNRAAHHGALFLFGTPHQQCAVSIYPPTRTGCPVRAKRTRRQKIRQARGFALQSGADRGPMSCPLSPTCCRCRPTTATTCRS